MRIYLIGIPYLVLFLAHLFLPSGFKNRRGLVIASLSYAVIAAITEASFQILWLANPDAFPEDSSAYSTLLLFGIYRITDAVAGTLLILPDPLVIVIAAATLYFKTFSSKNRYTALPSEPSESDRLLGGRDENQDDDEENDAEEIHEQPQDAQVVPLDSARRTAYATIASEVCLALGILLLALTSASLPSIFSVFYALYFCVALLAAATMSSRFFTSRYAIQLICSCLYGHFYDILRGHFVDILRGHFTNISLVHMVIY